jgi:uncharacterized protein
VMLLALDQDGRLHVAASNISRAAVNPYHGDEVPGWEALGLSPSKIYQLLRDGGELRKAAKTFNAVPILDHHIKNRIPRPLDVVGTTGSGAKYEHPYIRNSIHVWTDAAIAGIKSGDRAELSAAYDYRPDMRPGTFRGVAYDGVMRDIRAVNVCLVARSRAGHDMAIIGDARPHNFVSKLRPSLSTADSEARAY